MHETEMCHAILKYASSGKKYPLKLFDIFWAAAGNFDAKLHT